MNCLCCGKPLGKDDTQGWHKSCIKKFFGTNVLPEITLNEEALNALALDAINNGYSVPGIQKKLSLHLFSKRRSTPKLTLIDFPTGFILKPQVSRFNNLPEFEQLAMSMADLVGLRTVPHALMGCGDSYSYITKRVDRNIVDGKIEKFAMEDFCQLSNRITSDKYKGSYERCIKLIRRYSHNDNMDIVEFFLVLVFCFAIGNSDMHLKNFSLIETECGSERYRLSPAYDLLPVNVVMPEDNEEVALTLNGKKTNLRRGDFLDFASECSIEKTRALKLISMITDKKEPMIALIKNSLLPEESKLSFIDLLNNRISILNGR